MPGAGVVVVVVVVVVVGAAGVQYVSSDCVPFIESLFVSVP